MSDGMIVFVAAYPSVDDAKADFDAIRLLRREKFLGDYEAALFEKRADGEIKILDTDATSRGWGAKVGLVTGAVVGLIFPPSIVGMAALGTGVGAVAGNFMKGMSRADITAMGDLLDAGSAGLVLVGETTIDEGMERLMKRASKVLKKQVDAEADAIKKTIDESLG